MNQLTRFRGNETHKLSQKAQKIQFIMATIIASHILAMSSWPFSVLSNMEVLKEAVIEMRKQGTTVIFSTHDMDMAEKMCDRVFMIYKGKKVLDGTLDGIKSGYGADSVRIKMANGSELPETIEGVTQQTSRGRFIDLQLANESVRRSVLSQLVARGDIEHFETIRPTLHEIFVRIARI